jgi:hypothetical protein
MLAYLDTVIGFAVVMLVISLLITILTQVVSALLNHRGSNLLWGIKTLFARFDPKGYQHLSESAEAVARQVLTHPLISDSWFSGNRLARWLGKFPPLGALFARFQLAAAIRANELMDILQHLASNALDGQPVAGDINKLLNTTAAPVQATAAAVGAANVAAGVQQTVQTIQTDAARLEDWFGSMMDRVSQKFAMYMRIWTVAFAAVFAFGTGTNSIQLLSDLYTQGAFRNALVNAAPQVSSAAQTVLAAKPAADSSASDADKKVIQDALKSAADLQEISSQSGFQVIQLRWPIDFGKRPWQSQLRYILGVLMTTGLLSLGAPFWFNALKSMTNLRPVVASKESAEESES